MLIRTLFISTLLLLGSLSSFAQSSYNFNRSDTVSLNAVSKWKDIGGQDVAGASLGVQSNQGYPYHPTGSTFYGGVYWDSALTAPFQVRIVLKQLSATDNVKNFYLVVTNSTTFTSFGGYGIYLQEMNASGGDYMYLREPSNGNTIKNGGAGNTYPDGITGPLQSGNHVANDTFYINVYSDGRKTAARKRGATIDSLSTTDATFTVTSGAYIWLYGRVAPTPFLIDDFSITALSAPAAATDTESPVINSFNASNSVPDTGQSFTLIGSVSDNYGVNYVVVDSSQNGSTWVKWDSVKVNAGTSVTSYNYTSPSFSRSVADTVYFRMRVREDSSHAGVDHFDTSATVTVRITPAPASSQYDKKVFAWLTFQDTRWPAPYSGGTIPHDSIPWDVLTHASLFAANGANPPQSSYINQYPYLFERAHQSGVDAGICVGGSGDAALVSMIGNQAAWLPWINTYLGYLDNGANTNGDFIDFDLESGGQYSIANLEGFFSLLYDSLQVRQSGNKPARKPYIVLTASVPNSISWSTATIRSKVEFVNVMTYDYNNSAWGRITFDNSPKSYTNWDGTGAATDSQGTGVNAIAPSMQRMAKRVNAAGWPMNKINVGVDFNGGSWGYTSGFPKPRDPLTGMSGGGSNATFAGNWTSGANFSTTPSDSIFFDQIAQAYWFRRTNQLWTIIAMPGRDSGIYATRKIIDSMQLGGVCIWNFGNEVWNTPSVPPGGRGWFMSQIRTHFSGSTPPDTGILNPPTTFTPATGATGQATSLTLDWNNVTGASKYHIQVSQVGGASVVDDSTLAVSQRAVSGLSNSTQYQWRVRVENSTFRWGNYSEWQTFTTVPAVPGTPTLTSPADAATSQAQTLTFFWSAPGSGGTVTHYQFLLDDDVSFSSPFVSDSTLTITQRQVAGMANGTTYYWKVRAKSYAGGWGSYSTARSFATSSAIPAVPTLLTPVNGATNQAVLPTFTWTRPAGADSFQFQIDTTSDFTTPLKDTLTALASYGNQTLVSGLTYYWRVYSNGSAGNSGYANPFSLTIGVEAQPPAPGQPGNFIVHFDRAQGKYVSTGGSGFEVRNTPASSYLKPVDTNNVMWGPRGYVDIFGNVTTYATGSSGGTMTAQQILDSLKTLTLDSLTLSAPDIRNGINLKTGVAGEDTSSTISIKPQAVVGNSDIIIGNNSGSVAISGAGQRVDFQSLSLGEKLGAAYGGTQSDLSGRGGTSQVLLKESVGDTVTVRQLTTSDISGYSAGTVPNGARIIDSLNTNADNDTITKGLAFTDTLWLLNGTTVEGYIYSTTSYAVLSGGVAGSDGVMINDPNGGTSIRISPIAADNGVLIQTFPGTAGRHVTIQNRWSSTVENDSLFQLMDSSASGTGARVFKVSSKGSISGKDNILTGTNSFTTTATTDTVTVTGAATTDRYFITLTGSAAPSPNDAYRVQVTATGFVIHRSASGTSGLTYDWYRIRVIP